MAHLTTLITLLNQENEAAAKVYKLEREIENLASERDEIYKRYVDTEAKAYDIEQIIEREGDAYRRRDFENAKLLDIRMQIRDYLDKVGRGEVCQR